MTRSPSLRTVYVKPHVVRSRLRGAAGPAGSRRVRVHRRAAIDHPESQEWRGCGRCSTSRHCDLPRCAGARVAPSGSPDPQGPGNDKVIRDERLSHTARLRPTRARRSQTFPGARTVLGSCAGAEPGYARKVGIHLPGTGLVLILLAASVHPFQRSRQPLGASTRSAQTLKIERAIQRGAHAISLAGRKFQSAGDAKPI